MKRLVQELSEQHFDVVVLGGGVLGACVARDSALRGFSTALIEADDFGRGTSANSLKVVHGGLRHLQRLDLRELRRCARERSTWLRIAPHLVEPLPVVMPLFGGVGERVLYRTALAVNDFLSVDRNHDLPTERSIPSGRALSRRECLDRIPELEPTNLCGGVLYHDARMYSAERLVLAVVKGAAEAGALVINHAECNGPLIQGGQREGVEILDHFSGSTIAVRGRVIVNASGPGATALTRRFHDRTVSHPEGLSLAWNLNRTLSKLNYRIHTDAIKTHLIPAAVTPAQAAVTYANTSNEKAHLHRFFCRRLSLCCCDLWHSKGENKNNRRDKREVFAIRAFHYSFLR